MSLRDLHAVPETAMRKEMVILSFVPAPVAQQSALEVLVQSGPAQQRAFDECVVSQQYTSRRQRRVVPDLTVRHALVRRRYQRRARRDEPVTHACSELAGFLRRRAGLEKIQRENELQEPDRFQIRTEERARGAKDVVAIRVAEIL